MSEQEAIAVALEWAKRSGYPVKEVEITATFVSSSSWINKLHTFDHDSWLIGVAVFPGMDPEGYVVWVNDGTGQVCEPQSGGSPF